MIHSQEIKDKWKNLRLKQFSIYRTLLLMIFISSSSFAQDSIEGEWMLTLNGGKAQIDNSVVIGAPTDNKAAIIGQLSLKESNGN